MSSPHDDVAVQCPDEEHLQAFSSGQLPDANLAVIAEHVATCETCESALDTRDGGADVASTVANWRRWDRLFSDPGFQQIDSFVRSLSDRSLKVSPVGERQAGNGRVSGVMDTSNPEKGVCEPTQHALDSSVTESTDNDSLPEKFGRYFVVRRLGSGSFGHVYLAKDPEDGTFVAIKIPKREALKESDVQAFLTEARTVAELIHPRIVEVKDWGRTDLGGCYVVMDYVEGRPLSEILKSQSPDFERSASLMIDVAEAVHHAHRAGVYHRDIKPSNILIDTDDQAYVADFGLAMSDTRRWPHRNEVAGTLPFMAPEQVNGDAHVVDGRTDVYGVGVVLFRLLTGELPFKGGVDKIREEILKRPPPVPRTIDERVPAELESICLKCLSKQAVDRYRTALDLADDLRDWRDSQKTPKTTPAVVAPRGKSRFGVAVAALLTAVAFMALLAYIRSASSPKVTADDPLRWEELLGERPSEIVWPGYLGTHNFDFRNNPACLELTSDYPFLVRLGELADAPKFVAIDVRQPVWQGSTGFFFGYREVTDNAPRRAHFLAVVVTNIVDSRTGKRVSRIGFSKLEIAAESGLINGMADLGSLSFEMNRLDDVQRLELQFDQGQLRSVRCGTSVLKIESPDQANLQLNNLEMSGPWGVFHSFGTSWYSNPRIILEESSNAR